MAYPATEWTLLAKATLSGDAEGREALNRLCQIYWQPVRGTVQRSGWHEEADDLTQSFFVYVMENRLVRQAERERGTFRAFLKTVLRRFLAREWERRQTLKRGGRVEHSSYEDAEVPDGSESSADIEFDRQWAMAAMRAAQASVLAECESKRCRDATILLAPFLGGEGELPSYEEGAKGLDLSLSAFKSEVRHWRGRLREHLRAEVRRTVSAPHELDQEFSYLRQLLVG